MSDPRARKPHHAAAQRAVAMRELIALVGALAFMTFATPTRAVNGCLVLLCFGAPDWRAISQCVPPVQQVLNDLEHGRPFPNCPTAGASSQASNQWASAPENCPPQYTLASEGESGFVYRCSYSGVISMTIDGALWTRTWWDLTGDTATEFTDAAKASLGTWDTRFDDDYATWLRNQPPPAPGCAGC